MSQLAGLNVNSTKYRTTIPSLGKEVSYRPFKVADEKILMMAAESEDNLQVADAMESVIKRCYDDLEDVKLATFDIEYLFVQLRGKSVGEVQKVGIDCPSCQHQNTVEIDFDNVKLVKDATHTNVIKISEDLAVEFDYPKLSIIELLGDGSIENTIKAVASCLSKVYQDDEVIDCKNETIETKVEFVEQFTSLQFEKLQAFFATMPKLVYDVKQPCKNCEAVIEKKLEGMHSFFG